MCRIRHEGTYHGVGQGLFFSGSSRLYFPEKKAPSPTLRYVFDCGSEKYGRTLRGEIDSYVSYLSHYEEPLVLNVLFLSHLHWDHVSGLDYLLSKLKRQNVKVRTAVLPYLYPDERALVSAFASEGPAGPPPQDWYWRFINAPGSYLNRMGVERVVYIRGGDGEGEVSSADMIPVPPGEWTSDFHHEMQEAKVAFRGRPLSDEQRGRIRAAEADAGGEADTDKHAVYSSENTLYTEWWFFVLFNKEPRRDKLEKFMREAKRIRGSLPLSGLLDSAQRLGRLKAAYAKLFGTRRLNDTSLAVLSGTALPGRPGTHAVRQTRIRRWHGFPFARSRGIEEWYDHHPAHISHATVHAGDLPVVDVWPQLERKFGLVPSRSMTSVFEYQIPHHGSAHNWHPAQAALPGAPHYVITAGKASRFGHPDSVVLRDLAQAGCPLTLVTEDRSHSSSVDIMW